MDARPSSSDQMRSISRPASLALPGSSTAPAPQNKTGKTDADTNAARNATIAPRRILLPPGSAPPTAPGSNKPAAPGKPQPPARPATAADAANAPRTRRSRRWTRQNTRTPPAQTRRTPPTPPPLLSAASPAPARSPPASHPNEPPLPDTLPKPPTPAQLPGFPSPASSHRSWMCSNRLKFYFILKRVFRSKLFLLVPVPDRPIAQIRRVRQLLARIHRVPMPHRIQHRPVKQGIPVRVGLAQIDLDRPRHHFHRLSLRFSKIRFAQHTPRKNPVALLQPRRAHQNVALHPPRLQLALQ